MNIYEIIVIGIGLAMDASTVSMTNGMIEPRMRLKKALFIALTFGILQGIMPIVGFFSGRLFAEFINSISHYVAFIILTILGIIMILESLKKEEGEVKLTYPRIFVQGIATSIDALLIGLTFAILDVEIFGSSLIISIITTLFCLTSIYLGKKFGTLLKNKAQILGGFILIGIGLNTLFEIIF